MKNLKLKKNKFFITTNGNELFDLFALNYKTKEFFKKVNLDRSCHVVVQGDVLGQIAIDNHATVKDLMKWNNLKNTTIYQDQKLVLVEKGFISKETISKYKISNERFFWEILREKNYLTIKDLCNYNTYQELTPQQLFLIKEK